MDVYGVLLRVFIHLLHMAGGQVFLYTFLLIERHRSSTFLV